MSLNIKGLKEFIKDLPDDMEVTIESIISGEEQYCSETQDMYSSVDDNSGDQMLVLVPKQIQVQ